MAASLARLASRRRPAPWAAAGFVAALLLVVVTAVAQEARPFDPDERRRLIAGELVTRPETRIEGGFRYVGGTSWQRVRASRDRVWRVLQDVSHYPRLIPGVHEARRVREDGARRLVYLRHRYGLVSASYYAWVRAEPATHTLRFELDRSRPHDVRAGRGFLRVQPYRGDSIVSWGVRADVGAGLLTGVLEPLLREWILRVPWCVRGFVEPGRPRC